MDPNGLHPLPLSIARKLPDVAGCTTPLLKCLWALKAAKLSPTEPEFITADAVSHLLLRADVHLPCLRVQRALARAGDSVARQGRGASTLFRIVGSGERLLETAAGQQGPLTVHITGKTPWSDRRFVAQEAMKEASGEVRVLDRYFGMDSLDFIQGLQKTRSIRFLTAHPGRNVGQLQREIARFKKEFPNAEFRAYPTPNELHDRYLLFDKEVWFVGHGIKDLGNKESFVVILKEPFGKDVRKTLAASFDTRWAISPNF